jgi:hypothetical protein
MLFTLLVIVLVGYLITNNIIKYIMSLFIGYIILLIYVIIMGYLYD